MHNIRETLSKNMFKYKYPKQIDILLNYGMTRRQAKKYLRYKYILKYSKSGSIRLKAINNN